MKTRLIYTNINKKLIKWGAPREVRDLYKYLLTSEYITISGVFELPDAYIFLETLLTTEELKSAKKWLEEKGKVKFYNGWVYVLNVDDWNNYKNSSKNISAAENELKSIPIDIKHHFGIGKDISAIPEDTQPIPSDTSRIDSVSPTNQKTEINNQKPEIKNEKVLRKNKNEDISIFQYLPDLDISEEKREFLVREILSKLHDEHSTDFYRLVVAKIPDPQIFIALSEIGADGANDPPKLFTYKMRKIALQMGKSGDK